MLFNLISKYKALKNKLIYIYIQIKMSVNIMKPLPTTMKYYLNTALLNNKKNRLEFKQRAEELGFKGIPIRNNEITKSYLKFFNQTYKDLYKLKSNPVRDFQLTEPAKKVDNEGGYYLQTLNKYFEDKKPVNINISKPENLTKLLQSVLLKNKDTIITLTLNNGEKIGYTLNKDTTRTLLDIIDSEDTNLYFTSGEQDIETSDNKVLFSIFNKKVVSVEIAPPVKKKKNSGAFFKYLHNIKDLDLTDLQIYNNINSLKRNVPCCFIQSLISGGVNDYTITKAKELIKSRDIPTCKINELCVKLQIHITINKITDNKIIHYPNGKNELESFIRDSKEPIKIGLIDEHYFHIKEIPITSYAITHYEEIKHITDYHKIYKKNSNGIYKKSNERFIDSNKLIKLFYEDKEKYLTPISLCNEIYSTNYYDLFEEIKSLEYIEYGTVSEDELEPPPTSNVRPVEYKPKEDKDLMLNIFADFETTTDQDKHVPICLHIRNSEKKIIKTFIGEDCGKKALYYLSKLGRNIRFIFHNAGYDVRFLYQYLTHYSPIERGKFLLRAYAKFYYTQGQYYKIQIQDSYALIPEPLKKFSSMFNLKVEKEILPYKLYTRENVDIAFLSVDKCIEAVKNQFKENNIGKKINKQKEEEFINGFLSNVKKWKCMLDDKIDIIKYNVRYCEMDVEVLEQGYNTFRKNLFEITNNNIDINLYVSVASFSLDYMKINGVFDNVYEMSGIVREFINKCMYGGRTMCCENKKINNPVNQTIADFDAVGLYVSAQEKLQGYLKGTPKIITDLNYDNIKKYDGYFVEIMISKVNKKYKFPLMSKITKDGIREWTNDMNNETFYCDKTTLEEIIKYNKIEFKVIRGYYYNEGRNYKLLPTIRHLFNTRLQAKAQKNPIEKIYKLIMNSCYGKCLLKPIDTENKFLSNKNYKEFISANYNWVKDFEYIPANNSWKVKVIKPIDEHFNLVHCGVEVLSTSKRIMNSVMCLAEDLDIDMYYTDTDSIHIDNSKIDYLAEEYKKINNKELIGKNMSQFHTDFDSDILKGEILAKRSIFLGKKCYIDELVGSESGDLVDYHIRLKGIPNASILDYCENNNITPYDLYEKLYNKEVITFDLTCGGKKVNFQFNNDMTITTLNEFNRRISFQ